MKDLLTDVPKGWEFGMSRTMGTFLRGCCKLETTGSLLLEVEDGLKRWRGVGLKKN